MAKSAEDQEKLRKWSEFTDVLCLFEETVKLGNEEEIDNLYAYLCNLYSIEVYGKKMKRKHLTALGFYDTMKVD